MTWVTPSSRGFGGRSGRSRKSGIGETLVNLHARARLWLRSPPPRCFAGAQARDQRALLGGGEALDAGLLAHRLRAARALGDPDECDRPARARVAAGCSGAVLVEPPLRIGRPAAVERPVGAAEEVDEGAHPPE